MIRIDDVRAFIPGKGHPKISFRVGAELRLRFSLARGKTPEPLSHMTDAIQNLWFAHLLLTAPQSPDDTAWAIDEAERLLRDLPPSGTRDVGLEVVEAARGGDVDARRHLAESLYHARWLLERAREKKLTAAKLRSQRKRSLDRVFAKAKQLGVDVTVDEPNGTATFRTGTASAAVDKPQADLAEWIAKHAH
jgi:hypothetical protein